VNHHSPASPPSSSKVGRPPTKRVRVVSKRVGEAPPRGADSKFVYDYKGATSKQAPRPAPVQSSRATELLTSGGSSNEEQQRSASSLTVNPVVFPVTLTLSVFFGGLMLFFILLAVMQYRLMHTVAPKDYQALEAQSGRLSVLQRIVLGCVLVSTIVATVVVAVLFGLAASAGVPSATAATTTGRSMSVTPVSPSSNTDWLGNAAFQIL
jgi:hypothetical protein